LDGPKNDCELLPSTENLQRQILLVPIIRRRDDILATIHFNALLKNRGATRSFNRPFAPGDAVKMSKSSKNPIKIERKI
jgi:hypothetical protein